MYLTLFLELGFMCFLLLQYYDSNLIFSFHFLVHELCFCFMKIQYNYVSSQKRSLYVLVKAFYVELYEM